MKFYCYIHGDSNFSIFINQAGCMEFLYVYSHGATVQYMYCAVVMLHVHVHVF